MDIGRTKAADNILTTTEVGELLSKALENGKVSRGEKSDIQALVDEFGTEAAKNAARRFLALGDTFDGNLAGRIFGITQPQADRLEDARIMTTGDFLTKAATADAREALARETAIDKVILTDLAQRTDLARVVGVGPKYAALLEGVGIKSISDLGGKNPATLREQLCDFVKTPRGQEITNIRPGLAKVEKWVQNARLLPDVLRYVGDSGANFTLDGFNTLSTAEKCLLLSGADVRHPAGGAFEAAGLRRSVPRRKPATITALISDAERSGFDGSFNHVHLSSIERVRADDDTLGYVAIFEVAGDESFDYEGTSMDPLEGQVTLFFDKEGEVLDRWDDTWPGGDYEG